jgi:hypothetical protein
MLLLPMTQLISVVVLSGESHNNDDSEGDSNDGNNKAFSSSPSL